MTCSDFIEGFTDYLDGEASPEVVVRARRHRDGCESCRRYEEVFERGRALLRAGVDELEVPEDFHPRLQHRLFHVDDERALARTSRSSVLGAVGVLGAAALVMAAAWPPDLFDEPEVELSPIVVERPARLPLGLRMPMPSLLPSVSPAALDLDGGDLWGQPSALLFQYAPVHARYRRPGAQSAPVARAGLD